MNSHLIVVLNIYWSEEKMSQKLKADMMLLLVTLCWGVSYYLMDLCLEELQPLNLNAFRFLVAFAVAFIIAFPKLKGVNRITLKYSVLISLSLVGVYVGATYGVMYTSISNSGFLCALTVVFTPILAFIFKKQIPDKKLVLVVSMCVIGIALLTLNEELKPALGDILCLLGAIFYAVDLLITETAVEKENVNAFHLGVYQLLFTGIFMLVLSAVLETPKLPQSSAVWGGALFLAIFCTGLAFIIQAVAQQYTTASHVGVIFTLEPVFSGMVAFIFAHEVLLPRAYVGAFIMLMGMFIMEIDFKSIKEKRKHT